MDEFTVLVLSLFSALLIGICVCVSIDAYNKVTFVNDGYIQQEYCSEVSVKWVK